MICERVLEVGDEIDGTPPFIVDRSDPFYRCSDAGFHRSCYEKWERRTAFEAKLADTMERAKRDMPTIDQL